MLKSITLSIAVLASIGLTPSASAQSSAATLACPANYDVMSGNLCVHSASGDVVFATGPAVITYTSADCRKGYEHMSGNLCIHPKWGDVVFANERPTFAAASCRGGYEFLVNGLCLNRASGDIVFSDVKTGTTLAAVQK